MAAADTLDWADYTEILNLYATYNFSSDSGDADAYAACFTADGALRLTSMGFIRQGRDTLAAYKSAEAAGRGGRYRRHWNGNLHLVRCADGSVEGRCYILAYNGTPGQVPDLSDCGSYIDRIVQEDGRWKFADRALVLDGSGFTPPA